MANLDALRVVLEIGGEELAVVRCDVVEGVSVLGGASVVVAAAEHDLDASTLLGRDATLSLVPAAGDTRTFSLRVAEVAHQGTRDGVVRFGVELRPALWFLRFGKNVRKWRDLPTEAIVSMVLGENGVAHTWRLTRPCATRPWTVQYRETHLDFVQRLLEHEGIWFTFEPSGTLVLADRSPAAPPIDGESDIVELLTAEGALTEGARGITTIARGARIGSGKATVNDHDMKKPTTSLLQSATGATQTDLEVYDYPTGYRDPAVGAVLAQLRVEALECRKVFVRGTSSLPTLQSGRIFELQQMQEMTFGDRWFLTEVRHRFVAAQDGQPAAYENDFHAIVADVPFRPPLATPRPVIDGNHTAMVRGPAGEEIHTDTLGRAKIQFHWDREAVGSDADSRWVRVLQETSSSLALARVGWEVLVAYIDGDPDRPVAITRNINGEMTPTYEQPAKKNVMTIKTETYPGKAGFNEVKLDDSVGSMMMAVKAERMLANNVQHDKTETIGNDETHVVLDGYSRAIDKTQTVAIGADEKVDVSETAKLAVSANRSKRVGGSEKVKVGESTSVSVTGDDAETVGGVRRTFSGSIDISIPKPQDLLKSLVPSVSEVAGTLRAAVPTSGGLPTGAPSMQSLQAAARSLVPTPKGVLSQATGGLSDVRSVADLTQFLSGAITRDAGKRTSRSVGGAYIVLAGGNIAHDGQKVLAEVAGGLKLTVAAGENIAQTVTGQMGRVVGGVQRWKAKGDINVSAETSTVRVGATATFDAGDKLEMQSESIEIEAKAGLKMQSGDLLFELTPGGIKLAGDVKLDAGDKVKVVGGPDDLTAG